MYHCLLRNEHYQIQGMDYEELEAVGLTWNDRFEFMCRTHGFCGPSRITVERKE